MDPDRRIDAGWYYGLVEALSVGAAGVLEVSGLAYSLWLLLEANSTLAAGPSTLLCVYLPSRSIVHTVDNLTSLAQSAPIHV